MKLFSPLLQNSSVLKNKTAICLGNFDGLHLGHLALFSELNKRASRDIKKGVVSFAPHPRRVLDSRLLKDQREEQSFFQLTSTRKKIQLIKELSFDFFYLAHFTSNFSKLSAESFVREFLLPKLNPELVVIGYDWAFGKGREGGVEILKSLLSEKNIELVVVDAVELGGRRVSSSLLKEKLKKGDLAAYKKYSSRDFALFEKVKSGKSRGKVLGFPTANIYPKMQLLPPDGVYATRVRFNGHSYDAITNIGLRPTFSENQRTIETHIIDQSGLELYGKYIDISFIEFIREEKKFGSSEELAAQIERDIKQARGIFQLSKRDAKYCVSTDQARLSNDGSARPSNNCRDAIFCVSEEHESEIDLVVLEFALDEKYQGMRLDVALIEAFKNLDLTKEHQFLTATSRNKLSYWIQEGYILLDFANAKPSQRLKDFSKINLSLPPPKPNWLRADESIELSILFEDSEILVINKPAGLVVHPGAGHEEGTLAHALLSHLGSEIQAVGHPLRPGIVHRLDKDTSGLMVVAKTEFAYHNLISQFQAPRSIKRSYLAISHALPKTSEGVISLPIARDQNNKTKMCVDGQRGKEAVTHWLVKKNLKYGVCLDLKLETGRTHQIRVHLQAVGAEIIGDPVYGRGLSNQAKFVQDACKKMKRQALHAHRLEFIHPKTKQNLSFEADLPEDMQELIKCLS